MSKLADRIKKNLKRATREIPIMLDLNRTAELQAAVLEAQAAERALAKQEQANGDDRLGQATAAELRAEAAQSKLEQLMGELGELVATVQIEAMPEDLWRQLKRKYPLPEKPLDLDRKVGFNTEAVVTAALLDFAKLKDDDELSALTAVDIAELQTVGGGQWANLILEVVSLNETTGSQGVAALKAASSKIPGSDEN